MSDDDVELRSLLREIAVAERGPHPDLDELVACASATAADPSMETTHDHLALCAECAATVRDLRGGAEREDPGDAAAWQSLRPRVFGEDGAARAPEQAPRRSGGGAPPAWTRGAAAAGLLLAAGLLGAASHALWSRHVAGSRPQARAGFDTTRLELARSRDRARELEQTLAELGAPSVNVPSVDLYPSGFLRGGPAPARLLLPRGSDLFLIRIALEAPRDRSEYGLEVRDASGRPLWRTRGLRPGATGDLTVALRRGFLPPGRYRLVVVDTGSEDGLAAEYELLLAHG